jgi:hypothetical protein
LLPVPFFFRRSLPSVCSDCPLSLLAVSSLPAESGDIELEEINLQPKKKGKSSSSSSTSNGFFNLMGNTNGYEQLDTDEKE